MAHVGVTTTERENRQRLLVDLSLYLPLSQAGSTEDLNLTLDYAAVTQVLQRHLEKGTFLLVEAMAEQAAELILSEFKPQQVKVRIRKFSVPHADSVGVEILRSEEA
jgi:7,8-dihydroneopterin aldolase/epimerase/oxygenase